MVNRRVIVNAMRRHWHLLTKPWVPLVATALLAGCITAEKSQRIIVTLASGTEPRPANFEESIAAVRQIIVESGARYERPYRASPPYQPQANREPRFRTNPDLIHPVTGYCVSEPDCDTLVVVATGAWDHSLVVHIQQTIIFSGPLRGEARDIYDKILYRLRQHFGADRVRERWP